MSDPALSVVVPCFNEARNVPALLERFADAIGERPVELIVVNNGSTDDTADVLAGLLSKRPYGFARCVSVERNVGYGHGLMTGLREARADVVAITHADLQCDPADVIRAYERLHSEPDTAQVSPDLLTSPNAPILLIEYSRLHPVHGGRPTDIYDLLRSANSYELYALTRGKAEPSALRLIEHVDQLPYHDNIFCFLPAHRRQLPSGILINEIA